MTQPDPTRFAVAMFMWLNPEGSAALAHFRDAADDVFRRHDLKVERVIAFRAKGQIVGENHHDLPDLYQLVSFPNAAAFKAYVSDPDYVALAVDRDKALHRMVVMMGVSLDLGALATIGDAPIAERFYGVGLATFKPDGQAGMHDFNTRARELFARHGVHVESMMDVAQVIVPLGEVTDFTADRIVVFYLDNAASLKAYAQDPEYAALAPLRDNGLLAYPLFFGGIPASQAELKVTS